MWAGDKVMHRVSSLASHAHPFSSRGTSAFSSGFELDVIRPVDRDITRSHAHHEFSFGQPEPAGAAGGVARRSIAACGAPASVLACPSPPPASKGLRACVTCSAIRCWCVSARRWCARRGPRRCANRLQPQGPGPTRKSGVHGLPISPHPDLAGWPENHDQRLISRKRARLTRRGSRTNSRAIHTAAATGARSATSATTCSQIGASFGDRGKSIAICRRNSSKTSKLRIGRVSASGGTFSSHISAHRPPKPPQRDRDHRRRERAPAQDRDRDARRTARREARESSRQAT